MNIIKYKETAFYLRISGFNQISLIMKPLSLYLYKKTWFDQNCFRFGDKFYEKQKVEQGRQKISVISERTL